MLARVDIKERDELIGHRAHAHGMMPTSFILEYTQSFGGIKHRMKDLCDAGYMYQPIKRWKPFSPNRTDHFVYANDELMDDHLIKKEWFKTRSQAINRYNFHHELFLSTTTASIELGMRKACADFLFESQILGTANTREMPCHIEHTGRVWEKDAWAPTFDKSDKSLLSDAYFAIKRDGYVRYFVEVDCANESVYKTNLDEKSWRATLLKYIYVIEKGIYKSHFGLNSPALVILLFSRSSKMEAVKKLLLDLTKEQGKLYFLFKLWQAFDDPTFIPSKVNYGLVEDPYERVGHDAKGTPWAPIYL